MRYKIVISYILFFVSYSGFSQSDVSNKKNAKGNGDTLGLMSYKSFILIDRNICKGYILKSINYDVKVPSLKKTIVPSLKYKSLVSPFLVIHGNILYDVTYRSSIDTPFAEQNIYQHIVQTYLDITIKDHYPMRFYITNRFSNSSLFRNFTDLNFQFNPQQFNLQIKERIKKELQHRLLALDSNGIYAKLKHKMEELEYWQQWINSPSVAQLMIEAREKIMLDKQIKQADSNKASLASGLPDKSVVKMDLLNSLSRFKFGNKRDNRNMLSKSKADSMDKVLTAFPEKYAQKKKYIDSLSEQVRMLEVQYQKYRQQTSSYNNQSLTDIDNVKSIGQLKEKMRVLQLPDTILPKGYQNLFALKSVGIGRNMLDYSPLTASNISVTGIQAEYNPSYYAAVATGFVDYRFRNYTVQNKGPKQYLSLFRGGYGMKEGNHVFFSYYTGSRQLYNSSSTNGNSPANYRLVGYSVEGRYDVNNTSYVRAEFAKSSLPYYSRSVDKGSLLSDAVQYREHTNEAYLVELHSYIPATFTKFMGSFKRIGSNFQSFSVFTSGSAQSNYMARVEQPFFKRRLNVIGSIRTNEAINPYIGNNFKSSAVFKSIQATLRMRKWPVMSAGYYPSSQLTRLSDDEYSEQLFYTFVASLTHFYKYRKTLMNSTLSFNRFYNKATDSNFIYFNTSNILFSQFISADKFSFQANLSVSSNTDYTLYVVDNNCQYKIRDWLSIGGGVKYNTQPVYSKTLIGYSSNIILKIKTLGEFQFMMDKGFIPGSARQLVPNNMGRASYFKTF